MEKKLHIFFAATCCELSRWQDPSRRYSGSKKRRWAPFQPMNRFIFVFANKCLKADYATLAEAFFHFFSWWTLLKARLCNVPVTLKCPHLIGLWSTSSPTTPLFTFLFEHLLSGVNRWYGDGMFVCVFFQTCQHACCVSASLALFIVRRCPPRSPPFHYFQRKQAICTHALTKSEK